MILAQASRATSVAPWLWVLLALVVVQVLVITLAGPTRRRLERRRAAQPAQPAIAPPAQPAVAPPDWSAVERDLAELVGPAVRTLLDEHGGDAVDPGRVRELADDLARRVAATRGLDATSARALGQLLGDRLVEVVPRVPVG